MLTAQTDLERRDLRITRLYYFIFFAGTGFVSPFLTLFYVHQRLSGTQIGLITSVFALVTLLSAPYWMHRTIQWKNPRGALQIFLILTALTTLWLGQQTLFWGILAVNVLRAVVSAGNSPLSDSMALTITKAAHAGFGSVRVWGSFGWVVLVPISGWLVQRTGLSTSLIGSGLITFCAALILFLVSKTRFNVKPISDQLSSQVAPNFRAVLGTLQSNSLLVGLAATLILMGIGNSGVAQFENVYLQQLGANDTLIGIAGMLSAVVELPCMLWADRLVRKYGAPRILMTALIIYVGLRLSVLIAPSIAMIMLMRAAQGFAFSFYTVAITRLIAEQTAPHETRTALALYNVTLVNLVSIIGAPVAGAIFDSLGARSLYVFAVAGYGLAWGSLQLAKRRLPASAAS